MKESVMGYVLALAVGTACATVTNDMAFTATLDKSE